MFQVLVRVTDRDGNVMDRLLEIERTRKPVSDIEVYNSFTPNGDGINDGWGVPELRHYSGVSIQIFERSGKRVFYTQDPDHRWDGTFEGVDLPVGTYYWTVQVKETGETRKGMLNILKK
ncbi:MAG: gliding motility-associated C-terminal domain-containing protein [Cyclobacterium sp.]|uniref:gliding motility-associated C-terminal domain-containing protein n=1 Tax=Cyclobacterium sp. TaxID=1966343 RepID=UPI0039707E7A